MLLAFYFVARASATDLRAAPPPWRWTSARTMGGGSVKDSPHYTQLKPISRPRFKKNVCNTAEREKIRAEYVCRIRPRWRRSTTRALMYDRQETRLDDTRDEVGGGASRGGRQKEVCCHAARIFEA